MALMTDDVDFSPVAYVHTQELRLHPTSIMRRKTHPSSAASVSAAAFVLDNPTQPFAKRSRGIDEVPWERKPWEHPSLMGEFDVGLAGFEGFAEASLLPPPPLSPVEGAPVLVLAKEDPGFDWLSTAVPATAPGASTPMEQDSPVPERPEPLVPASEKGTAAMLEDDVWSLHWPDPVLPPPTLPAAAERPLPSLTLPVLSITPLSLVLPTVLPPLSNATVPPPPANPWLPFWQDLARFLQERWLRVMDVSPPAGWLHYVTSQWQPCAEPDDAVLDQWARGVFPVATHPPAPATPPPSLSVSASDALVLPEGWFCLWSDMSALRRWHAFWCIEARIAVERELDEPLLPAWSFQFLLVALLWGSEVMRSRAWALLQTLGDLTRWHDASVFSGGFLRREMVRYLQSEATLPSELTQCLTRMWPQTHAVAFYEQVENWRTDQYWVSPHVPGLQGCRPEDFERPEFKLKSCLFQAVERVQGDDVWLKYHGCPRPLPRKLASIKQPRVLAAVHAWQRAHVTQ